MEKFTKGPWFISEHQMIKSESSKTATGAISAPGISCPMYKCEEAEANAALIAAAPEMYEMLQKLRAHYNFSEYCENEVDALLSKARGEQ